ncbi:MAG: methyl-accepting chemotaxis protein [Betaproteobacteria bacterium]|nr:methyl-accepting chemotaxis protein [Betaproteobacteria bacterium]MDE2622772.1 methyl-accepting chemotaxis protein [Betaproteobacteria bacterium]
MSAKNVLSIKGKLNALIAVVMLGLFLISAFSLLTEKSQLLKDRQVKTQHLVQVAYKILEHEYELQAKGEVSEAQAQSAAISIIKSLRYDGNEYFWINDMHPNVIMHPTKPELDGKDVSDLKDPTGKRLFVEAVHVVKSGNEGYLSYKWPKPGFSQPVDKISYVKGFAPWGWVIGSGIYLDDVDTIFWSSIKKQLAIVLLLSAFIYLMLQLIIRSIILPLTAIRLEIKAIRETRDLTRHVKISRRDEIGDIAIAFNEMVDSFQGVIQRMVSGMHELRESSDHLHEASASVSDSSRLQRDATASMTAATEQMLVSIEHVSDNSRHTHEIALESGNLSSRGEQIVRAAADEMNRIAQAVNQSSAAINQLGEESKQISAIVQTIKEIADQTNLLALNAAIEAARAGEQGRGFAVVADEVRKLAERTSKSTTEIASMIERIQVETSEAVISMRRGSERVTEGVNQAQLAGSSMANIRTGAESVVGAVNEISIALQQQTIAGQEVAKGVEHIAHLADSNFSTVNDITQTAERLSALANQLQDTIEQFKV